MRANSAHDAQTLVALISEELYIHRAGMADRMDVVLYQLLPALAECLRGLETAAAAAVPKPEKAKRCVLGTTVTVQTLMADGLAETTAVEWLEHRKRRKAVLTQRAWEGIKREAARAGWTTEAAVCKALARGWVGFEAAWVDDSRAAGGNGSSRQSSNAAAAEVAKLQLFGDGGIAGDSKRV